MSWWMLSAAGAAVAVDLSSKKKSRPQPVRWLERWRPLAEWREGLALPHSRPWMVVVVVGRQSCAGWCEGDTESGWSERAGVSDGGVSWRQWLRWKN